MGKLEQWDLANGYSIARVAKLPEPQYTEMFKAHMLGGHPILPWRSHLSEQQKNQQTHLRNLVKDRFELRLALLHENNLIGWTYGWQDSVHEGDFYMASSLVIPEHRRNNLYQSMVQKVLEITSSEGFSAIRSRHVCTNNAVLIAKLKLGFIINGFEQDDTMGTLVRMIYCHDELRKQSTYFRAGLYEQERILDVLLPLKR